MTRRQQYSVPAAFDMVFVTWGAISWLPDLRRWAEIVAHFLMPGGSLYLAEGHPAAMVFDDAALLSDGRPGFFAPYFSGEPVVMEEAHDYVDETAKARQCNDLHMDTSAQRHHLQSHDRGFGFGLVSRARRRDMAHVQDIGAGR